MNGDQEITKIISIHTCRSETKIPLSGPRGTREFCYRRVSPFSAFALRFASKEAFSKALGLGMRKGLKWRDIEVFNDPNGKPGLRLHGRSSDICHEAGITGIHLSLSDDSGYGVAMVVLEKGDG